MKKVSLAICFVIISLTSLAQEENAPTPLLDRAIEACLAMSDAASNNDTAAMRAVSDTLTNLNLSYFGGLRCQDSDKDSVTLEGHVVFDNLFAETFVNGGDAFENADELENKDTHRGQTSDGSILTKTCFVKAKGSTVYRFPSKGHQELAVVAESGGLVTMRIHVTNSKGLDVRYDDIKDVHQGKQHRKVSFDMPTNVKNNVELEVINCGDKDISFVVISN